MLPIKDQIDLEMRKFILPEAYEEWLETPNAKLDFRTPKELLSIGEYQPLWTLVYKLSA